MSWFRLDRKFGFVAMDDGSCDAFLHVAVLKPAGYVSIPAGTMLQVRVEQEEDRRRVVDVIHVDTSTARARNAAPCAAQA